MKEVKPLDALKRFVEKHPTQRDAAAALGISSPYLYDLLNGHRGISDAVLAKLGLRRIVVK